MRQCKQMALCTVKKQLPLKNFLQFKHSVIGTRLQSEVIFTHSLKATVEAEPVHICSFKIPAELVSLGAEVSMVRVSN